MNSALTHPSEESTGPAPSTDTPASTLSTDAGDQVAAAELNAWQRISFGAAHRTASLFFAILGVKGLYWLGRVIGTVEWMVNFKRRRRFGQVLHTVFNPLSARIRRQHTREHFMQTRCDKLFYLIFDRIPRETALTRLTIHNQDLLDRALTGGNGVYVALCHHGPIHLVGMLMAVRGYKVAGVRDRREGAMRRYVQNLFDRKYPEFGRARVLYADSFPREIYRCLQDGFVLGSAMDVSRVRDPRQRSHEVKIFDRPQVFLTGPLRIAIRCRTPVLQAFLLPSHDFCYELQIVESLVDYETIHNEEETVERAIVRYAQNVENYVRAYPALITRT